MQALFYSAREFNQDLSNWDVSSNMFLDRMFENAYKFNQDLSNWDVGRVIWFGRMFKRAFKFNYDLSNWNVGSATLMNEMFVYARSFDQTLCWDIPDTATTTDMFLGTSSSLGCPPTGNPTEFPTNPSDHSS